MAASPIQHRRRTRRGSFVEPRHGFLASLVDRIAQPAVLARAAKLNRKTVHSHLAAMEDMRDDGAMDRLLDELRDKMIRRACSLVMASLGGAA